MMLLSPDTGTRLQQLGKYQLVRKLAVGGMAEVYLAKAAGPMGFEKTLVLKRILPNLAADPHFVEMFLAEAKLAARLNHPNIAQIFDFGEAEGSFFIAMEHVDGPNLRSLSRRATERGAALPVGLCAKIVSYACEGLAYAHDFVDPQTGTPLSLIHRDVSPDNVLLSRNGAVKVVDFGIAKAAGQQHQTKAGILRGKISYMPPEQIQGKEIDRRADIYALGVVLYELITGCKPFDARTEVTIIQAILYEQMIPVVARRPDIPEVVGRILQRALAKDPDARYGNCRDFQAELERFIVGTGETVGPYQLAKLISQLSGSATAFAAPPTPQAGVAKVDTPAAAHTPPSPSLRSSARRSTSALVAPPARAMLVRSGSLSHTPTQRMHTSVPRRAGTLLGIIIGALLVIMGGGYVVLRQTRGEDGEAEAVLRETQAPTEHAAGASGSDRSGSRERLPPAEPTPARPAEGNSSGARDRVAPEEADAAKSSKPLPVKRAPGTRTFASKSRTARQMLARTEAAEEPAAEAPKPSQTMASLEVDSVPPGQVRVNGKVLGSSPVKIRDQRPGEIRVEVFNPTLGFSKEQVFSIASGDNGTRRILVSQASVEFRVRPYATVLLDGKQLGQTPLPPVQVYEGKHRVKLVNRELGKEVSVDYVVKPGQPNIFKYNLGE